MPSANAALDRIGTLDRQPQVTFDNTVRALDDIGFQISGRDEPARICIKETSTNAAVRDAATEAVKQLAGMGGRARLSRGCLSRGQGLRRHEARS